MNKDDMFVDITQQFPNLKCLWEVGLKRGLRNGTIDLLACCSGGGIARYGLEVSELLLTTCPDTTVYVSDDSVRFESMSFRGGVAICDYAYFMGQIDAWLSGKELGGQHRPWATGYWLPETLCGDLVTARCLHDTGDIHASVQQRLTPYPSVLAQAIDVLCVDEIRQKIDKVALLNGQDTPIEFHLCIADIAASMVRLAFARSRQYFRGFRAIEIQSHNLHNKDVVLYSLALKLLQNDRTEETIDDIRKVL
jgi:hypothetical protein